MVYALVVGSAAFVLSLVAGGPVVALLRRSGLGKAISADGPASHAVKAGTPTMGGLLIFGAVFLVTAPTNLTGHRSIFLPLGAIVAAGLLGLIDDYLTLERNERIEAHARAHMIVKLGALTALGLTAALVLYYGLDARSINVPHFGKHEIGLFYIPVAVAILVGTTSAVAVTDGLDALAGGTAALAFGAYGVIAFLQEQTFLATFSFTVVGATLGFLWYNAHPATVFMGDTGAMALGSALAVVALMTGQWLLLPVVGVVFVIEALSDVIQIAVFRLAGGRRVFRMTPLHHHFELLGWSEPQVVTRFWLIGMVGGLLGIALALTIS
jgi:phospho-N-acetylmuramoyl-pentapeptide-transferase